ncbi:hypothetical protein ACE1AT_09665 [Pelatocladus sp. BLCC-F211]|uniref:hypothetical protein n=1 Tax=Pelatocladus sp. BLCC-F211 TaxID=3342752 RepID=UPI0035B8F068
MGDFQHTHTKKGQHSNSTFEASSLQPRSSLVQTQSQQSPPAPQAELWEDYQQAKQFGHKGENIPVRPAAEGKEIIGSESEVAVQRYITSDGTVDQKQLELWENYQRAKQFGHKGKNIPVRPPEGTSPLPIQAKLTIGQPGDKYEQEADRVAATVVNRINTPSSGSQKSNVTSQTQSVQRQDVAPEEKKEKIGSESEAGMELEEIPKEKQSELEKLQTNFVVDEIQRQILPNANIEHKKAEFDIQCQSPAPAAGVNKPNPPPPGSETENGKHENQQIGTWGVWSKTPLIAGKREKEDFATREGAIAYARGMGKAAAVFEEDGKFIVYPVTYSSLIYSFTYSGTRMFHGSNISDVMGVAGVLALITEDGTAILPHQYGGENDYKSWMEQQDALKSGENPFDAHKEAFGEGLGKITGKEKFLKQFELAMRDTVIAMLDRSQQEAKTKQQEMAEGLPTKDAKIIHKAAKELEEVDKELTTWKAKQSNLSAAVEHPVPFNEEFNDKAKRELEEASKKVSELELQRKTILLEYPLLSQVNPAEFNKLNDADQAKMLGSASGQVLQDIEETRKNVTSGDLNLWALDSIVKTTLAGLGITDAERQQWATDKAKQEKKIDTAITIALAALQIGLSIAATAVGGPAGVAFAVGALGVGVADAARMTDKYFTDKAAANTDINKDKALVPADLEGQWAWLVVAWVGVGLSYVDVIKAVRVVKAGAGAAEVIASESSKLAKASGVEESAILKAAGQAGKTSPDRTALRKLLLSALPDEKMAEKFKELSVNVLKPEEFIEKFGSKSGDAVTTFKQGKDGELIAEVFFKETGNPLAMREEAVHIAQAADKEMGAKLAKLSESNLSNWGKLETEQQLQLYKTKIEVEIDAQQRLLKQFAGGEPEYLAEIQGNLENLQKRLGEVEQAIKDPNLIKQGKIPWWDTNQPPRLQFLL